MLIAVVSDTHRMPRYIDMAREEIKNADVLIHLGDNTEDIESLTKQFKGLVYGVRGNCDFTNTYPKEQIIELCGKRILATHGDLYGVKHDMSNIFYRGKECEADIILFGHTHEQVIFEEEDMIFMNPGSISLPKLSGRHVGFINLEEGKKAKVYLNEIKVFR